MSLNKSLLVLTFFFAWSSLAIAEKTSIEGHTVELSGKRVSLYGYKDFVTESRVLLDWTEIDSEGNFILRADITSIKYVQLHSDHIAAYMYLQPGSTYDVEFPLPSADEPRSFGKKARTEVIFNNLDINDINADIIDFNYNYELFFQRNYDLLRKVFAPKNASTEKDSSAQQLPRGKNALNSLFDQVEGFTKTMDSIYSKSDRPYFELYRNSVLGDLMMNSKATRREIYEKFIDPYSFNMDHPEFTRLHQRFFNQYFAEFSQLGHETELDKAINENGSYAELLELLKRDDFLSQADRKDYVIGMALREVWRSRAIEKIKAIEIINDMAILGTTEQSRAFAMSLKEQLTARTKGFSLKNFKFEDQFNEPRSIESFQGSPLLIEFWADWCTNCAQERVLSQSLAKEYQGTFKLLSIELSDDDGVNADSSNDDIIQCVLSSEAQIILDYGILSLPFYVLLDEKGMVLKESAPMPSGQLEELLFKIKADSKEKKGFRIGGRKN